MIGGQWSRDPGADSGWCRAGDHDPQGGAALHRAVLPRQDRGRALLHAAAAARAGGRGGGGRVRGGRRVWGLRGGLGGGLCWQL